MLPPTFLENDFRSVTVFLDDTGYLKLWVLTDTCPALTHCGSHRKNHVRNGQKING